MEEIVKNLVSVLTNLKKSSGRGYSYETILQKLQLIEELKENFETLTIDDTNEENSNALKIEFYKTYTIIKQQLLDQLQSKREEGKKDKQEVIMSSFNLELAIKAVPLFNGQYKELSSFLTITEIIHNGLNTDGKKSLIEFICNVKLSNTVKTSICAVSEPKTFGELKDKLEARYKSTKTIPIIHTTLSNLKQKSSISNFNENILTLISELSDMQIKDLPTTATETEKQVITNMNDKYALTIFKNGLNEKYKSTVYAAQPQTLVDAVNIASELENDSNQNNPQILHINRVFRRNNNFRGNYNRQFNNNKSNYRNNNFNSNRYENNRNFLQNNNRNFGQSNNRTNNNNTSNNPTRSFHNNNYNRTTYNNQRGSLNQNSNRNTQISNNRNIRGNYRQVNMINNSGNVQAPGGTQEALPGNHY